MQRNPVKLSDTEHDLLIIGGGIYGIANAWDATLRGLKVALIEKGDFAGATSSNSLKIIHGGLRYLQSLDIKRMRQSIYERMVLMRIAPHLVFPLPVVMPTYGHKTKSSAALFIALLANDIIGFDRNRASAVDKHLPGGHLISKEDFTDYVPGYKNDSMSGGALWYDCMCHNTERLVLSYALSAAGSGAQLANYVECTDFIIDGDSVKGIKARDVLGGETFEIRAGMIINTTGPWIDEVIKKTDRKSVRKRFEYSSAMNLVVNKKVLGKNAAGLPGPFQYQNKDGTIYRGSQMLFFAPWRDHTIIGTNHLPYNGDPDDYKVSETEISDFLKVINRAYPSADIKREDVSFFHGGLLPMRGVNSRSGEVKLENHFRIHDHKAEDGIDGLISVVGVKYTTHRYVAGKTIDFVFEKTGRKSNGSGTEDCHVHGGDVGEFQDFLPGVLRETGLDENISTHLAYTYGSGYKAILKYADEDAALMQRVSGSSEVIKAEVLNGVQNEMAQKLSDVVLRRTDIGSAGNPGDKALGEIARLMGSKLGWDDARIEKEIHETNGIYKPAI